MSLSSELNSLVKIKKIKKGLASAPAQNPIGTTKGASEGSGPGSSNTSGPVSPLTLEYLTYDATKDVEFEDTSAATHTFKTVATAKLIDANGTEWLIDTITNSAI